MTKLIHHQLEILELGNKIQSQVKGDMDKRQREYYLRQQLKAIKEELGETDDAGVELEEYRTKIKERNLPELAVKEAERELDRLSRMHPSSAEYTVAMTYLDWLTELPWNESTEDNLDIKKARAVLDEDHFGLEKAKRRIIEYLAVRKLKPDSKGPILCFAGPPGTGKTSWAIPSPGPWAANFTASHWVACATRPKSADTGVPMWEPCPAASFRGCGGPDPTTRSSCSMKSTRWAPISGAIPHRPCSKYWIRNKTSPFPITTWMFPLTCPR